MGPGHIPSVKNRFDQYESLKNIRIGYVYLELDEGCTYVGLVAHWVTRSFT